MGLNQRRFLAVSAAFLLSSSALSAAARLGMVSSTVGPISIAQGTNGPAQTVEIYNAGDGSLSPKLSIDSSSISWIGTSTGPPRACASRPGVCTPVQISLSTAGLPAGTVTGIVTVADNDANAVDAPQTITVTAAIGGTVPSSLDVYVAPGASRDVAFATNSPLAAAIRTNDGGPWLSLAIDGTGSFQFTIPYRVRFAPTSNMLTGTYSGTLTTSGSKFAADNKAIPVTMRVTTQPIAQASTDRLKIGLAQGAPPLSTGIGLSNVGQGTLTVQSATGTANGGTWLTATSNAGGAALTFDAGALAAGRYTGTVAIASNAVNGTVTVPIDFVVAAKGAPAINYQGVVDNGTFGAGDTVARGDILAVFGDQLSFSAFTASPAPPLATVLGGASVLVNGRQAPMYYSSYGQLAFQIPYEIANGIAVVQVQRDGLTSNLVSVLVADRAPRLLLIGVGTYGAIQNQDLSFPLPVGAFPGVSTHPAKAGDALTIYAIGLGPTSPSVSSGQAAPGTPPLATLTATATVNFGGSIGGTAVVPLFAGLAPNFVGLYQVNVVVPEGLTKGVVNLKLGFSDSVSNSVQIYVQ